jgi:hypothetical protein
MTTPKIKAAMQAINQDNVLKRHLTDIEGAEAWSASTTWRRRTSTPCCPP